MISNKINPDMVHFVFVVHLIPWRSVTFLCWLEIVISWTSRSIVSPGK